MDSARQHGFVANPSTIAALVAADGTAADRHAGSLRTATATTRDLADAVHSICALHGHQPGVVDHARGHCADLVCADWLAATAEAFAAERAHLARLAAAAGPLPSTPGQAESEAAVVAQRHALDILAQSDRTGCALGAAVALALDWRAIRGVLDAAATRFGIELARSTMDDAVTDALLSHGTGAATDRARAFGAQQLLAQHRGLWHLLDARASARGHS